MPFGEIVYEWTHGHTMDKMWSQKHILSPCDRWAKTIIGTPSYLVFWVSLGTNEN